MKSLKAVEKQLQINPAESESGQVIFEYALILTFIVGVLFLARVPVEAASNGGQPLMVAISEAMTRWLKDIFLMICLPS